MNTPELVPTSIAARDIGVAARTLQLWVTQRRISPTLVLPSGHQRWDLDDLHHQIARLREQPAEGTP